jgi:hypothetical protein
MTEPIPALVYHQPQLGRRPLFVALAILAIVFGLVAAISSFTSLTSYISLVTSQRASPANAGMRYSIVPYIFSEIARLPSYICLAAAGAAFLLKSRWVPLLLCIYLCISIISVSVSWAVSSFMSLPAGMSIMTSFIRIVPSIGRVSFDVAILLLLLNKTVQTLIHQASGIDVTMLPDQFRAG